MKILKFFALSLILLLLIFLSGCNLPLLKKQKAALQVLSTPTTTVFLNGNHMGKTSYTNKNLKAGEYTIKLVPDSNDNNLAPWEKMIKLYPGIMTVVKQNLAEDMDKASGYIITLEPIADKKKAMLSIISTPDGVVVNLDGEPKGLTPLALDKIAAGERQINISSPGFKEESIQAKAVNGYKLIINVQLAKEEEKIIDTEKEASPSAEKTSQSVKEETNNDKEKEASPGAKMAKPYVEIKDTPTGWLNVRSEPSTSAKDETILTQVNPGEVYKFIEANETGWYKIEYEKGKEGWISGKYAKLYK